jgi:hypothetical protein
MTTEVTIVVDPEFIAICRDILTSGRTLKEWALVESDDIFQSGRYEGGYDATEEAFCFSRYEPNGDELWFQLTLDEIKQVAEGVTTEIAALTCPPSE